MAQKTCYKVCAQVGLQYRADKIIKTVTPETGVFDPSELGITNDKIKQWTDEKVIEKILVDDGNQTKVAPAKGGVTPKGTPRKLWDCNADDLAELSLEELNMKVQEIAASKKVAKKDVPAAFKDEISAIEFLTKDA